MDKLILEFNNEIYEPSVTPIEVGDVVLDNKDFLCGTVDFIKDGYASVQDNGVSECHIPIERLRKFVKSPELTREFNENNT